MNCDINCDLGEGESRALTRQLIGQVTSINVACGGHAGDLRSMEACIGMAMESGVRIGAHPGPNDREHFGRRPVNLSVPELQVLLLQQVGGFEKLVRACGGRLHHIKLHGALYHCVESNEELASALLRMVHAYWPKVKIYGSATGKLVKLAKREKGLVWGEVFLDRGYEVEGSLTERSAKGALLSSWNQVRERYRDVVERGGVRTREGNWLSMECRTLCVHSDTPGVLGWLKRLRRLKEV